VLLLTGFAPLVRADATRLVLGSMPSRLSLDKQQYFGNPRNAFWAICARALEFDARDPYPQRCAALIDARIAVWDVVHACVRKSSLDADIEEDSIVTNNFSTLFATCPFLHTIYFNGATAERLFRRHVMPQFPDRFATIAMLRLPSTSPANAAMNFDAKFARWSRVFDDAADIVDR
jgi:TDG/mug DNA glycosylase family protein